MQITVIKVGPPESQPGKSGRGYKKLPVLYKNNRGEEKTKWLVSFSNPNVFKVFSEAQPGDVFEVKTQENEKGHIDWVRAEKVGEGEPVVDNTRGVKEGAPLKVTITEADRQRSIVRQSSLSTATNFLKDRTENGKGPTAADILAVAQLFEDFVNRPADSRVTIKKPDEPDEVLGEDRPRKPVRKPRRQVVEADPVDDDEEEEVE